MTITKHDVDQILISMDDGARDAFSTMPREEQLLVIFGLEMSNSNRLAIVERRQIDFERDSREYRNVRETRERNHSDDVMTTTGKIADEIRRAFAQRFDWSVYFRDRILPTILTAISLGLLYLVFGGKLP
jgi:hypothetical protein